LSRQKVKESSKKLQLVDFVFVANAFFYNIGRISGKTGGLDA